MWRSPLATMLVELTLFAIGAAVYAAATRPRDRAGRYGLWALLVFLLVLYAASALSPPPPSVSALAWGAMIGWPLTIWPWWIDRHRDPVLIDSR